MNNDYSPNQAKKQRKKEDNYRVLEKLTLNLNYNCNLSCIYCYSVLDAAKQPKKRMSDEIALKAINYVLKRYDRIKFVNFFGGEPLLHFDLIEKVCNYFYYLNSKGVIGEIPGFGITTNGTILNKAVINHLLSFNFNINISLDGPEPIHNLLRKYKKGSGSFERINDNIHRLLNSNIFPEFECTYTMLHIKNGITISDLLDFFYGEYKCHILHVPVVVTDFSNPSYISQEAAKSVLYESIDYSLKNLANGQKKITTYVYRLLNSLTSKTPVINYCPAFGSSLYVNPVGSVYPCPMLFQDQFHISSIDEEGDIKMNKILFDNDKSWSKECTMCWARNLCFGCFAEDLNLARKNIFRSSVPKKSEICDRKREMIEFSFKSILKYHLI